MHALVERIGIPGCTRRRTRQPRVPHSPSSLTPREVPHRRGQPATPKSIVAGRTEPADRLTQRSRNGQMGHFTSACLSAENIDGWHSATGSSAVIAGPPRRTKYGAATELILRDGLDALASTPSPRGCTVRGHHLSPRRRQDPHSRRRAAAHRRRHHRHGARRGRRPDGAGAGRPRHRRVAGASSGPTRCDDS